MRKILVTGGAGFIGSEFVREGIKRGYEIIVVDNLTYAGDRERIKEVEKGITFHRTDITDKESLEEIFKKEKPEAVIHWAAESHVDRSIMDATPFVESNVKGTLLLLEVSRRYGIKKFINISTDEVYGELGKEGQFYETTPLNPNSPYSVSKTSADMFGRTYYRTYGLSVITIRPSNNYGPWQYPEKFIPVVILKALNNERIPVYGKGENVREWLFVSDCAEAVFLIMEKGDGGEIYNIGSGEERKNIEVAERILKILGKDNRLIEFTKDRLGHDYRYSLNSEKVQKNLGWQNRISFDEGIEMTVRWYIDNMEWVKNKLDYVKRYWETVYT